MKKLRGFLLASFVTMVSFAPMCAMEQFVGEYPFLKTFIFDIQNEARDLMQETHAQYKIVTQSDLLKRCLKALGLSVNSTPLDVRYHYELMKEKLTDHDGLLNIITKVYNQLMHMLSEVNNYKREIKHLVAMSFEELQAMELEDTDEFMHAFFLENENKLIDATIAQLKKEHEQYVASHQVSDQFGLPIVLQKAFNLPADASPHMVDEHYSNYLQEYQEYSNNLIAQAIIKNISINKLKKRLDEAAKVIEAYNRYVEKRGK